MNDSRGNRSGQAIAGLFLIFVGLSALGVEAPIALIIMALGGWLLYRQWQERAAPAEDWDDEFEDEYVSRQSGIEKVYEHALKAVGRAGLNPDEISVLPVDMGLMVFKGAEDPMVYRTQSIPDDADFVQPFVQLRLPQRAVGRVKFEIIDGDGQVLFIHEDIHNLERGRNLLTPAARLPIHDAQAMSNAWHLRISADGTVLANHRFEWQESSARLMRRHMREDGEISNELRATLDESRLQGLSLDELLEFQNDEREPKQRQRKP
jgi:hypothetical protein